MARRLCRRPERSAGSIIVSTTQNRFQLKPTAPVAGPAGTPVTPDIPYWDNSTGQVIIDFYLTDSSGNVSTMETTPTLNQSSQQAQTANGVLYATEAICSSADCTDFASLYTIQPSGSGAKVQLVVIYRRSCGADPVELGRIANQTFVRTGAAHDGRVVILEGVHGGDLVVGSGQLKIQSGAPVAVKKDDVLAPPSIVPRQ